MSTSFNRRNLLRAAGAAAFVTPFTQAFTRTALGAPPKRLITFWHANGAPAVGEWGSLLEPLNKADLLQIKNMAFGGNADHKLGMPMSTTGYLTEVTDAGKAPGMSLDMMVAKASGKPALLLAGRTKPQNYRGWISYDESLSPALPIESPREAYISLFGKDPGGPGLPPAPGKLYPELETAILNAAKTDANELLARMPMGGKDAKDKLLKAANDERGKISSYLSALGTTEKFLASTSRTPGAAAACGEGDKIVTKFKEPEPYWLVDDRIKLHVELIIASFLCDLTRAATLMVTPGGHDEMDFGYLGVKSEAGKPVDLHNGVAHYVDNDGGKMPTPAQMVTGERSRRLMRLVKTWDMKFLALLIQRLKETPEPGGGGSLFDNTLILSTTEMGNANHRAPQVPIFLSGGLVRRGAELAMPGNATSDNPRLLLTAGKLVGAPLAAVAGQTAPIDGVGV